MKKYILSAILILLVSTMHGQVLSVDNLLNAASLPQPKFDAYLLKKTFANAGKSQHADTSLTTYKYIKPIPKKNRPADSTERILTRADLKESFSITYQTTSPDEYYSLKLQMREQGFYCRQEDDSASLPLLLYQHNDITIFTSSFLKDSIQYYSLRVQKKIFPEAKDIYYADDLLAFSSHEYLVYFFGEANVKKDFFFLSGNEVAKCSVLFPNTPRQVVFIWKDEINRLSISNLLLGGQQQLKSSMDNAAFVGESNWISKSGVRAGMTLYELRKLNDNNFKFYGGRSPNTGAIIPVNNGKLDFKKEDIILGCINCDDAGFSRATEIDADDALAEGRIIFVLSVSLNAGIIAKAD